MKRVLNKRLLRDLKSNFARYTALFLMIIFGMFMVIAVVGAAETFITGSTAKAEENRVQDGYFTVFLPLDDAQEQILTDTGIDLEEQFSLDIKMQDSSVLRVFANRESIDLVNVDEGRIAEKTGEAVIEKRYAEEHKISVGDVIEVSGHSLVITGTGSSPDYDMPIAKLSDTGVESSTFGTIFVHKEQYRLIKNTEGVPAEEYCYAYRLNGAVTDNELKEMIKDLEFDYNAVEDIYFRELIEDTIGKKEDMQEGISELAEGAKELSEGLSELDKNSDKLNSGTESILEGYLEIGNSALSALNAPETLTEDNYSEILDGYIALTDSEQLIALKAVLDGITEYNKGVREYTDGVNKAYKGSEELAEGTAELKKETDEFLNEISVDIDNLTEFLKAEDNPRIRAAANDVITYKNIGLIAGVVLMILFTYVISVFVIHQIQRESSVIGALYALGAKKRDLIGHYIALPTIICLAGGIIGSAIGFSRFGIVWQMSDTYNYFSVPDLEPVYPLYLIIYAVVMPPVISVIVNYIVISKKLSRTALSLIRNEQKISRRGRIELGNMGFIRRFQIRQTLREARAALTVVFGMFICLLVFMLGMNCYTLCNNLKNDNIADVKFENMYTLKYPEREVPENAEACYAEELSVNYMGYTLSVSLMGIDDDNKYYPCDPEKGMNSITASSAAAQKYDLSIGDKFILTDSANDKDYAFTVSDIADYSIGLTVFMDIESMRELFGKDEDYYNVLLSDENLDIESGRIYAVTTREDITRAAGIFVSQMKTMYTMLITVSAVIFFVVMYLMINVIIDRASFGISLVKIFGFRTNEIKKLYLNGNIVIIALGALVSIPVSKLIMNKLFPVFIANSACGMDFDFPPYMYAVIFAVIMLIYFIINALLVNKLKKITPAEVLKNRE